MVSLYSKDKAFDSFWKTRRAAPELAEALSESAGNEWLEGFRGPFARNIKSLSVTSESVTVVVDFGSLPCIPADAIRTLLPACAELADRIEPRPESVAAVEVAEPVAAAPSVDLGQTRGPGASAGYGAPHSFVALWVGLALVALACKLGLAWLAEGTRDAHALGQLAALARQLGGDVFAAQPGFAQPPLMVGVLGLLGWLAVVTGVGVGFWSRALASVADAGTLLLCYHLMRPRLADPAARGSLLMLAAWPAALALTGFHGGWHAVMVFLVVLSIHRTVA
jgi:hypothetical protein